MPDARVRRDWQKKGQQPAFNLCIPTCAYTEVRIPDARKQTDTDRFMLHASGCAYTTAFKAHLCRHGPQAFQHLYGAATHARSDFENSCETPTA